MSDFKPCRGCGAQLHVTAVTCPKCGAPQSDTVASPNAAASALPTATLRYSDIPFYRRRWCFTLMFLVLMPVAMLVALTGPLYRLRKQTVEKLPTSWRVTYVLLAVVWMGLAVAEFAVTLNRGGVFSSSGACGDSGTTALVKDIFLKDATTALAATGAAAEANAALKRMTISISGVRTNAATKGNKKLSCTATMEITIPAAAAAALNSPMAKVFFGSNATTQSVQTEGNRVRDQINYTSQLADNGKEFFVEVTGYEGLLGIVTLVATSDLGESSKEPASPNPAANPAVAPVKAPIVSALNQTDNAAASPGLSSPGPTPAVVAAAAVPVTIAEPVKNEPVTVAVPSACAVGTKSVFVCLTSAARKRVEVCDAGASVSYSFGKIGDKPELTFAARKASASGFRWDGFTRGMTNSLNLPNGTTEYRVYSGIERDPNGTSWAGVHVVVNGKQVADVTCDINTVRSDLEGLDVKPAQTW